MARKRKGDTVAAKPQKDTKAKASDLLRVPTDNEIRNAVKRLDGMAKGIAESTGDMGSYVNKLADDKHFDKRALGIVRRLHKMSDERFAITWPHLLKYAEALGFDGRADKQGEMYAEDESEDDDSKGTPPGERDLRRGRAGGGLRTIEGGAGTGTFRPVGEAAAAAE